MYTLSILYHILFPTHIHYNTNDYRITNTKANNIINTLYTPHSYIISIDCMGVYGSMGLSKTIV